MKSQTRLSLLALGLVTAAALGAIARQLPELGAGGLLHPMRRAVSAPRPAECEDATFAGEGVTLKGCRCAAASERRGTLIYLHGVADNRGSGRGVIERFTRRGFDVIAYDSRAHGDSQGESCTYGFFEKEDSPHVLDAVQPGPIVLLGTSLGAAVALQEAPIDPRVSAVVAAETFADFGLWHPSELPSSSPRASSGWLLLALNRSAVSVSMRSAPWRQPPASQHPFYWFTAKTIATPHRSTPAAFTRRWPGRATPACSRSASQRVSSGLGVGRSTELD